jgi:ribosome-binding protein aMBF1 (putative translation factor)
MISVYETIFCFTEARARGMTTTTDIGSPFRKAFGARMRALRKQQGLTLKEVSTVVGLHKTVLSRVENGTYKLDVGYAELIGELLGVDGSKLMEVDDEP